MTSAGASAESQASPALEVVTSIFPLELIVRELAGDRIGVHTLVPPGASPHMFEPRPGDIRTLARARYFLRVGHGLDDWTGRLRSAAPASLETVTLVDLVAPAEPADIDQTGAQPPHFWLDPILVRDVIAPGLTRLFIAADPAGEALYRRHARTFERSLSALDQEIRERLSGGGAGRYVAFHGAWRYFARRYELQEVAVVQQFAGEEPTPRELAWLIEAARKAGVRAILVEPQLDPRAARVIAAEFGGITVQVDPLGTPDDPSRASYLELMRFNAEAIAHALTREPR
jgi:ABC-type Zn uptake system ZnuABC Zn-binding protein ZnuA